MTGLHRRRAAWCFVWCVLLGPAVARAQVIHVVIAADTNAEGIGTDADLRQVQEVFEACVPRNQLDLHTVSGDGLSKRNILGTISRIRARERDGMAFFFSGHGAYDERGHFMAMPDRERLYRSEVVAAVARCGAGSDAVLTDCCNVFSPLPSRPVGEPLIPRGMAPLFRSLFLDSRGLADINGCSEGEFGFGDPQFGGSFFGPLCRYFMANSQRQVTWHELVAAMRRDVQAEFNARFPRGYENEQTGQTQTTQSVRVWHLPPGFPGQGGNGGGGGGGGGNGGGGTGGIRFGVYVADHRGPGVVVTHVFRGSPAARAQVARGDVILAVNGRTISSVPQMLHAVAHSPQKMQFRLRGGRTGRIYDLTVTLGGQIGSPAPDGVGSPAPNEVGSPAPSVGSPPEPGSPAPE